MLDPKYLRSEIDEAAARLATRGYVLDVAAVNVLEEKRKDLQSRTQELQAERNARSKSIGEAARRGEDVAPLKAEVTKINDELETSKVELEALLVTRSENGMTLIREGQPELHLPALGRAQVERMIGKGSENLLLSAMAHLGEPDPAARLPEAWAAYQRHYLHVNGRFSQVFDGALASLRLKHVDLKDCSIFQDAREVKTKASKTIQTWFFPVDPAYREFFTGWVTHLRHERLFGPNDALFPKTRIAAVYGRFTPVGLHRTPYADASRLRESVKAAFETVDLPKFAPHSFRRTLVALANEYCKTPEQFKAWSRNLGHDDIATTLYAYCPVSTGRQRELIKRMTDEDGVIE